MRISFLATLAAVLLSVCSQGVPTRAETKALVVLMAHADDESPVGPILSRYAREGLQVYLIIATDGMQGAGSNGFIPRADSRPPGEDLVRARAEEARCASDALGVH